MTPAHRTPNLSDLTLVLWGAGGDEAVAIIFVGALRAAACLVKLVGLGGTAIKGQSGVVLVPDITLGDALPLASRATHVILPFTEQTLKNFTTDPRLSELVTTAHSHGAIFLQSDLVDEAASLPTLFPSTTPYKLIRYPNGAALYEFASSFCAEKGAEDDLEPDLNSGPTL